MGKDKIIAMIPARMGSTRLAMKNLVLIDGRPMIYYAIAAAKAAGIFDRIVLNSENAIFGEIAKRYSVDFYLRPEKLGSSTAKSDDVVDDFMSRYPAEITAWVNPTSPLQTGEEIRKVVECFISEQLDTLITVRSEQVHALYGGRPLNFKVDEQFAQTQDIMPVERFVYSVMMWRNEVFRRTFSVKGYALFCGKIGYFPVSKESALIVKTEEDIKLIDYIATGKAMKAGAPLTYDPIAPRSTE